uniref:(California timema) hypothetical protein n=1 Tax=Timema californicum TaxID=61474 RepID=A0A7R9JGS5_TIMCA|nr:unnamed protein product [Timema californicum]
MFSLKDSFYSTFGMLDKAETCVAVTVYNLAQGKGVIIGDTVAIPEPYLSQVRFKYEDKVRTRTLPLPSQVQVRGQGTNRDVSPEPYTSQVRFKYKAQTQHFGT